MQRLPQDEQCRLCLAFDEFSQPHDPFVLRKALVLLAAIPAAIFGFFWDSLFAGVSLYFVLVTVADLVSHFVLKLKPSREVDPDKLMLSEQVTPEQFTTAKAISEG